MNGSSAMKLSNWTIEDVKTPDGYLRYLFGGMEGFVYRGVIHPSTKRYTQSACHISNIDRLQFEGVVNGYISMNSFWRSKVLKRSIGRNVSHLKRLLSFYVDVDCYKLGISKKAAYEMILQMVADGIIPEPTFINDSGQGLTLVYKLENEDCKAHSRWRAIQEYLIRVLSPVGADANCVDAARVLRVPGSINSKSNTPVHVLYFSDRSYTIHEIIRDYNIKLPPSQKKVKASKREGAVYPYNHATQKQRDYVQVLACKLGLKESQYPDFTSFHATSEWIKKHSALANSCATAGQNPAGGDSISSFRPINSILAGYCADIEKLLKMRKPTVVRKRNGKEDRGCMRETGLFMYRYFLREMGFSKNQALRQTLELNNAMKEPLSLKEAQFATESADKRIDSGLCYRYKRSSIITRLNITAEELKSLPNLAGRAPVAKEYRSVANHRAYKNRLAASGKTLKKDSVLQRRAQLLALQEEGKTAQEIQETLQISKATYYRDSAALKIEEILMAAKAILGEMAEQIKNTVEKIAENLSNAAEHVQNTDYAAFIRHALEKKTAFLAQSHFFSTPFIRRAPALLPNTYLNNKEYIHRVLGACRAGDRGSGDDATNIAPDSVP